MKYFTVIKMDELHYTGEYHKYISQKKPETKEIIICDSTYVKSKDTKIEQVTCIHFMFMYVIC